MYSRQKVLLYLTSLLSRNKAKITKTTLDKMLFLLKKETGIGKLVKFYNFYPHKYGPFSNQFYFDLGDLQSRGYLDAECNLKMPEEEIASLLGEKEKELAKGIVEKYGFSNIVGQVYAKYPEYTKRSLLIGNKKEPAQPGIFSIGYEKKDIDLFLDILIQNDIEILVDVRHNPFSMNFAYTGKKLSGYLEKAGIGYMHMPELGINGEHRKGLKRGLEYEKLFRFYKNEILPKQAEKIELLAELGKKKRIALMCFEQDKAYCHRSVISESIENKGLAVTHL